MSNKELFLLLQKNRREAADILERPSLKGVRYSVVEKYSEQAHFIYELLQNADDVKATKVRFVLQEKGLIFIHNGTIKFNITNPNEEDSQELKIGHINAITSIGNSSKKDLQIGKFGVGFKSVFQYTNNPEIYEDEFKFYIDRFIVPIEKEKDHPLRKKGETLFYFPFNNASMPASQAYQEVSSKFQTLETPLIFIQSLDEIQWETLENNGFYSKKIQNSIKWKNLVIEYVDAFEQKETDRLNYLTFTDKVGTSKKYKIVLAFLLKEGGQINSGRRFPAYCFFPTKEITNLKFIIQAPFLLIDNRQGIKRGNGWNKNLIEQLSKLLLKALDFFKEKNLVNDEFFNVLPIEKDFFEGTNLFYPFYEKIRENLLDINNKVFPTKEKLFTNKENSFLADNERILDLLSSKQLSDLLNTKASWIFPSLTGVRRRKDILGNYLLEEIGIKEFTPRIFIKHLNAAFLSKQDDEWLNNFYRYVSTSSNLWGELRKLPIIRTDDNKQITPFNKSNELSVFLPNDTPTSFSVIKPIFLEDKIVMDFLVGLGLKKPDLKAEIELVIIPQYRKGKQLTFKKNLAYFNILLTHYQHASVYEQNSFVAKIKDLPIVEGIDNLEEKRQLIKTNLVYVKNKNLQLFFENYKEKIYWLSNSFIKKVLEKFEKRIFIDFLLRLGIGFYPRQLAERIELSAKNKKRLGLNIVKWTREYTITDFNIEGLENAIAPENISPEKSKTIWDILIKSFNNNKFHKQGIYRYFYFAQKNSYFEPAFIKLLKRRAWLYKKNTSSPISPKSITQELLAEAGYELDNYAAQQIIIALSIKNNNTPIDITDWNEEEKLELLDKAKQYDEYKEFINNIPKDRLRQVLKEQQILKSRQLNQDKETFPKTQIVHGNNLFTKEELVAELNNIKIKNNAINDLSLSTIIESQKTELAILQDKLTSATIVEDEEQKVLYANLMDLRDFSIELSHVIKTALSKVMNQALFFKEEFPNENFENLFEIYAQEMHFELQRLRRVVEFMLNYTEAEKFYKSFDISPLIEYVFQSLHKTEIEQENIKVNLNLNKSITLYYNIKSFEDIISNLITNSIKALKEKKENKKITCSTLIDKETNEFIILFSDNGHGIKESVKNRIFDAYVTTTQELGGAGIGLYIVKMKLKALGGYIEPVKSEFNQGASFKIALPLN